MAMTLQQLEAEVTRLKKQVDENARASDYIEIWKLQSRYAHLYHIGKMSEEDSGVYEGIESITRFWSTVFSEKRKGPGNLALHMTVNPVIEINRARTRARGVWHSHGFCSFVGGGFSKQFLCLGKYDMEYVKEDGQWKIFKFAYRLTFMCPYEKGWIDEPVGASIAGSPENIPDKPTTYFMPYSRYRINVMLPPPPEPYDD
jgi:hypothetical protein